MGKRILPDRPLTAAERSRRWVIAHPERAKEFARTYRENNREKVRAAVRACRLKHLEEYRKRERDRNRERWKNDPEWRITLRDRKRLAYNNNPEHKETRKRSNSKWNKSPRGRHYQRTYEHKYRRGDKGWLTFYEWVEILDSQDHTCAICGKPFGDKLPPQRDHIFPFKLGGRLVKENVQALCKPCNTRKADKLFLSPT